MESNTASLIRHMRTGIDKPIKRWAILNAAILSTINSDNKSFTAKELYHLPGILPLAESSDKVARMLSDMHHFHKIGRVPVRIPGSHAKFAYCKLSDDAIQNKINPVDKFLQVNAVKDRKQPRVLSEKPRITVTNKTVTIDLPHISIVITTP